MPISVNELVEKVGLPSKLLNRVDWGESVKSRNEGVYIVAMPKPLKRIPLDEEKTMSDYREIDNMPTDDFTLIEKRISKFWLPDETILYIGQASKRKRDTGIGKRVQEYYNTVNGKSGKHSGGSWLKYINIPSKTSVYYIECADSESYEAEMLCAFFEQISKENRKRLFGTGIVLPFANREVKVIHGLCTKKK